MSEEPEWTSEAPVRRGPRGPRMGSVEAAAAAGATNRVASSLMNHEDPSMLLLRRDIQDHARTRRKSVTMSSMPDDERAELEDCWRALEIDGEVNVKQLIKAADLVLGAGTYSERNVRRAFGVLDVTHSGQVDWITFRAFMTANWNAGRNADDALWTENRKRGDDMLLVDGSMRLVDLIKAYRRRTLVDRALKDAQGQLREMQHKRDSGVEDSPTASSGAQAAASTGGGPRVRRRSITYDADDVAARLSGGPGTTRRQTQSDKLPGSGGAAPSRLRRAQAEALAAAGLEAAPERDWSQFEHAEDNDLRPSLNGSSPEQSSTRLLPLIVGSSPTSPQSVDLSGDKVSRFSRPLVSPLKPSTPPMTPMGTRPLSLSSIQPASTSLPQSQLHTSQSQHAATPQHDSPAHQGPHGNRNGSRPEEEADLTSPRMQTHRLQSEQAQHLGMVSQAPPAQQQPEPPHDYRQSRQGNRANHGKNVPKRAESAAQLGILSPIKQDISAGFGRLAKFFWKSAPADHHAAAVSVAPDAQRNRLPRI